MQNSVKCARSILSLIKNGINLISNQYDYHEFIVRLSINEGENVIVLYGQDKSSSIQRHALP
jgi:adenylate cyclase